VTTNVLAMAFAQAGRLWILAAVAALAALYVVLQTRRQRYAVRFTNLDLLDAVAPERPGWRRHLPALAFLAAAALLVVSLAGPTRSELVPKERATIMLAIDVSKSMNATDVKPTRLKAAQDAAIGFLSDVPATLNIGLVTFAGTATVAVAPTTDRSRVKQAIERIKVAQGTAIGDAIAASLDAIAQAPGGGGTPNGTSSGNTASDAGTDGTTSDSTGAGGNGSTASDPGTGSGSGSGSEKIPARIVLMSDGSTNSGRPDSEGIRLAQAAGVPVSTIAFGTANGVLVDPSLSEPVAVPVDKAALRRIADETGGNFAAAASEAELTKVFADIGSDIGFDRQTRDISTWFTAMALVALLGCGAMSIAWFSRLP
jgi:Ca-activated chloride channel homolog